MKPPLSCLALVLLLFVPHTLLSQEEKVDAGIFSGQTPDTLIIKARTTYTIPGQSMTNAQLTIKWSASSPVTGLQWLSSPIGLFPQGEVEISEGYRYLVYSSFGGSNINWQQGQEYPILKLKTGTTSGDCTEFEIALDDWTIQHNGDYYIEILGADRTGVRYEPSVHFGSDGGHVDGDRTIYLGESTGEMALSDYNGNIMQWERSINQGSWDILAGTAGLEVVEDTPTLAGTWAYRVKVEKPGCPPEYSDTAVITVELLAIWTGSISTAWEDPGNWNVAGVPDSTLDARVPEVGAGFYPLINEDMNAKNLVVDENASLTISQLGTLSLSGVLENNGNLIMHSYAASSACLLDQGVTGTGIFTSEVIFWPPDSYHLFSSPVMHSTTAAFEDLYLFGWDEPSGNFIPIDPGNDTIDIFTGYLATGALPDQSLVHFEGNGLATGDYSILLTNNGENNGHSGGFNLLGNPYPSAINWNDDENLLLDQVDPAIYILDGNSGNYGTYLRNDEGSRTLGIDSLLAIHQGFFVHVNHNSESGSISINNGARVKNNKPLREVCTRLMPGPYLKLRITEPAVGLEDQVVVRFLDNASSGFDKQHDAYDLKGLTMAPQLYTTTPDMLELAVNTYPPLSTNTTIPLGFIAGTQDTYQLSVMGLYNFGTDTLLFLEDLKLDTLYNLSAGFNLTFDAVPEDDPNRFVLHFQVEPVYINSWNNAVECIIRVSGKTVTITHPNKNLESLVEIFDPAGRVILSTTLAGASNSIHCNVESGIYLIRINNRDSSQTRKIFIN